MVRSTALALTALTGFSALVYEVAWQKYVTTLLGSHSEATAAVLALFLGGLSAGYALFGRITGRVVERSAERGRPPRLLLLYGLVEASIGVHALIFPWLFLGVQSLSLALPRLGTGAGFALDVALVALLILPPTVLMGGTIPVLTQALSRSLADATRLHALVYGCNTAGAFLGALLAGFALVPWLGLQRVVLAMGVVNLVAGAGFGALGLVRRGALGDEAEPRASLRLGLLAPVALLSGFAAMALQTVLIRVGGLSIGSSEFTFSMVVAVFVLCIAVGSFAVSALPRIPRGLLLAVQCALALVLGLLYLGVGDAPYWAHVLRSAFRDEAVSFYLYQAVLFGCILSVLAVPVGLSGATLPLIFHQLRQEFGGLGSAAGRLYAWNTVGSLLGALLGGYLLLFWLDLDEVYAVALAAVVASAGLLAIRLFDPPRVAALLLLPILALPALLPGWQHERLASGLFRTRKPTPATLLGPDAFPWLRPPYRIAFYTDDPVSSVAVLEAVDPDGGILDVAIATNGKPDGSIRADYPTMAIAALLPALFTARAERAFVIGFGTGVTVGELAALDSVERVVVAEISPGVIEGASFFEARNRGARSSPKTEVLISDAYRALRRANEHFDVIVSEPSNPWVAGVEMLFSREFLVAARQQLTPTGVYAQWFHLYEVDNEVVSLVMRTYASVFDRVAVWFTLKGDVLLLGFNDDDAEIDLAELERRAALPDFAAALRRVGIESFAGLLAHEILPLGVTATAARDGDVHTLLHPVLSHRAARAFFFGRTADLPPTTHASAIEIGERNALLARYRRLHGGRLSEADYEAAADQVCGVRRRLCGATLSRWQLDHPDSEARERFLTAQRTRRADAEELAPSLLDDLAVLQGARPLPRKRLPISEAIRLTRLYEKYHHHGAAFDRTALAEIWRRCQDAQIGVQCGAARRRAEQRLGPLPNPSPE